MRETIEFLVRHGYAVLFFAVLAEQIGLPVPAIPILLGFGALAGAGRFSLALSLLAALAAALLGDLLWYRLGRRRGHSVLKLLCRISLEPDSCVRRTENAFTRYGERSLLVAKFVPGLSTAAPPLAGMFGMSPARFLLWDSAGTLLWAGVYMGAGYVFSAELERAAGMALRLGSWLVVLLVGGLAAYIGWKYVQRRRFLRGLWVSRITPEELMRQMEAGGNIVVVDLRQLAAEAERLKVRGALHMTPEELDLRHQEIPRDRDIILYCA